MKNERFECPNKSCTKTHKSKSQASTCCSRQNKKPKFNRNKDGKKWMP